MERMEELLGRPLGEVLTKLQERVMMGTTYRGVRTYKWPLDAWVYQELIWRVKPDVIVEIGTKFGGSALMLADMMQTMRGTGVWVDPLVITVDVDHSRVTDWVRKDGRIAFITGDACNMACEVAKWLEMEFMDTRYRYAMALRRELQPRDEEREDPAHFGPPVVMVIEDSAHTYEYTLQVLEVYGQMVSRGSYFIVEDGICTVGLGKTRLYGAGPVGAVEAYLAPGGKGEGLFELDRSLEWPVTWNPKGYLKRL